MFRNGVFDAGLGERLRTKFLSDCQNSVPHNEFPHELIERFVISV